MSNKAVQSVTSPKLIWLLFMHRHGDRTPLNMAPMDKYNDISYWPEGFGNLTNAGRLRMFKLGKFIRQRYDGFITDDIRTIYSRSSDVERCIESSMAVLAGLVPPKGRFCWNQDLPWIPIPIHSVPGPDDYILNEAGKKYVNDYINEIRNLQNTEKVKKLYEESPQERELLTREMGYEFDNFIKFKCIYSTLDIEENTGLKMPDWYTPVLKQKLYSLAGAAFGLAGGGTEHIRKMRSGNLLQDMISRMESVTPNGFMLGQHSEFHLYNSEAFNRKIVHFSTHDSIIASLLECLNINSPPIPPAFGATFFFELYADLDEQGNQCGEKYLKIYYLDDTETEKPIEKCLPNCKLDERGRLTVDNFKEYVKHLLP